MASATEWAGGELAESAARLGAASDTKVASNAISANRAARVKRSRASLSLAGAIIFMSQPSVLKHTIEPPGMVGPIRVAQQQ